MGWVRLLSNPIDQSPRLLEPRVPPSPLSTPMLPAAAASPSLPHLTIAAAPGIPSSRNPSPAPEISSEKVLSHHHVSLHHPLS